MKKEERKEARKEARVKRLRKKKTRHNKSREIRNESEEVIKAYKEYGSKMKDRR